MPRLRMLASVFVAAILCGSILAANVTAPTVQSLNLGTPPARVGLYADTQPTIQSFNQMPLAFTKNMGQWDDRVLFRANAGGATMWFTKEGVTYQFTRTIARRGDPMGRPGQIQPKMGDSPSRPYDPADRDSIDQLVLTAKFVGTNPNPEVVGEGQMEYKCNYFLGNDPAKWHTDVPNYEAITLKDIYPGIDLKYSGDGNGRAAYEFISAPGSDIAQIKVAYEGAEETTLDDEGNLILRTKWGDMTAAMRSPTDGVLSGNTSCAWWTSSSTTSPPDLAHGDVRQAQAEKSGTLTLAYSTYLGGGADDAGIRIAVDDSGDAYVMGETNSSNFPIQDPYQTYLDSPDVFVTKLSSNGNGLIYSTYLGGAGSEQGYGIAVDGSYNAYVTGWTNSSNFPTWNPYQRNQDSTDAFVTKLSSSGNSLIYSTYLGGGSTDAGYGIAVDGGGNAYVTGCTWSSSFPTENPYQTFQGNDDVFVTKLSSSGASLIYSTYLGGKYYDWGNGITVDDSGSAYVTGGTKSPNFPILNPYQTYQGSQDAFVAKLSTSGSGLIYSTYLGGGNSDNGEGIAVDGGGNAYVTGQTSSSNFPTLNPFQTDQGYYDAFVIKLSSSGNTLIYSTYLGGGGWDLGWSIAIDDGGNAYVTGQTESSDFPTLNPYQAFQGGTDVFVAKLSSSGATLIYGTYLGGASGDDGYGIAVDSVGNAYVTGKTESSDFPTLNPFQATYQGGLCDAFVTKLTWTPDYSCGDVNTDEQVDLVDVVFLINYIFVGGPAPQQLSLADVNCSGSINIGDVVLMINYIFRGGAAPCAECE